tara:strand:+ start:25 stop:486 length:462 start_codon:yes stop_codon:yes gene_type:complete
MKYLTIILFITSTLYGTEIVHEFKNPAFSGVGYAQHVITIENQEFTRRETKRKSAEAALAKAVRDAENTNLSKFMNNLESRVYATLSAKLVETMFGNETSEAQNSGIISFEGNTISYQKLIDTIQLTIQEAGGSITIVDIPISGIVIPTSAGG